MRYLREFVGRKQWRIIYRSKVETPQILPNLPSTLNKMEQSSVRGSKRWPSMLSLQPPKLKPPQQITKHREADLPRTPYPLPSKGGRRSVSFSEQDDSSQEGEAKKRKIAGEGGTLSTPPCLASFPSSLESGCPPSRYRVIPPVELKKAWESILDQVDWSEVVQEAEGRENPDIYRDVFRKIVESHIAKLLKQGEYGKDMEIELGKQDEDTDTESGNDSSEEGGGDGFRYFENNTFLESDESGCGSEDYTDGETDDEEDSDDEDQDDDDCEVNDDWVSV